MSAELAARYVGRSASGFRAGVGTKWPEPIRDGGKVLWDRNDLDAAVDLLKSKDAASPQSWGGRINEIREADAH
jgi:hypothetical protein